MSDYDRPCDVEPDCDTPRHEDVSVPFREVIAEGECYPWFTDVQDAIASVAHRLKSDRLVAAAREWATARAAALLNITGDGSGKAYLERLAKAEEDLRDAVAALENRIVEKAEVRLKWHTFDRFGVYLATSL
jgi:hypothetical protein